MDRTSITLVNFPRSGTFYVQDLVADVFPNIELQWTHNVYGFKLPNPLTIVRKPNQSISSWIEYTKTNRKTFDERVANVIKWYERFMNQALNSKTTFFCFDDFTNNPKILVDYFAQKTNQKNVEFEIKEYDKNANSDRYDVIDDLEPRLKKSFNLYNEAKERYLEESL
jgi:hypothetical protein